MVEKAKWERPPADDDVGRRLRLLVESVENQLGEAVSVQRQSPPNASVEIVRLEPSRPDACFAAWIEMGGSELILCVGKGGRWELPRDVESVTFVEGAVEAVIDGRVVEVFAPGRSRVTVTLGNGTQRSSVVANFPWGIIPLPYWRRWGKLVRYSHYW